MKIVFLHGLGQTAQDWNLVLEQLHCTDTDCPELFSLDGQAVTYANVFAQLERRYAGTAEPFVLCGLSLGAILALDYAIRHADQVSSLILIGVQYKVPTLLIDFQNLIFRCMPRKAFESMGISKSDMIQLSRSMRSLDFRAKLSEVSCPVTIVCGEKDHANKKAAKQLNALLPQSQLQIIPSAGHEVNKCAPASIASILNHGKRKCDGR